MSEQWYCPNCGPLCGNQYTKREIQGHAGSTRDYVQCLICGCRDRMRDKPPPFVLALQQRIATLEAACEASARWYKFHKRGFPIATPQAEELMVHYLRAAGYLNTEREE